MPYFQYPDSKMCNNKKSAMCHSEFVSLSIKQLFKNGLILQVIDVLHVVNPLTVYGTAKDKERWF